ncbi:MerR family transcriptional regulator [Glycomyces arizonensis]|uniref:MerR family transcriptional regulator n=1 Tax=Glycomyces arizonensis TaxID=256035 RepID=UPI00041047F3|nr:MerR family transcriptional regulator [Glycomyces arizonensis]
MRIGELSARTGVPTATIKYYVREGLLSGGERIRHNQVSYGEGHVRRLRLVRALVETGSLPIAKVREILAEVDDPRRDLDSALGVLSRALGRTREAADPEPADLEAAMAIADRHGWAAMGAEHPQMKALADVIGTLRLLGLEALIDRADDYAGAARIVAETDIEMLAAQTDRDAVLESMIIGTVIGDAFFAAMRRLAHIELSGRRFKAHENSPDDTADD